MKKAVSLFFAVVLALSLTFSAYAESGETIVCITRTGEKYHNFGCQYLRQSCIEITLADAVEAGYTRCSKCHPPSLDTLAKSPPASIVVPSFDISSVPTPMPVPTLPDTSRYPSGSSTYTPKQTPAPTPAPVPKESPLKSVSSVIVRAFEIIVIAFLALISFPGMLLLSCISSLIDKVKQSRKNTR